MGRKLFLQRDIKTTNHKEIDTFVYIKMKTSDNEKTKSAQTLQIGKNICATLTIDKRESLSLYSSLM